MRFSNNKRRMPNEENQLFPTRTFKIEGRARLASVEIGIRVAVALKVKVV